jgi:hypothetical protein
MREMKALVRRFWTILSQMGILSHFGLFKSKISDHFGLFQAILRPFQIISDQFRLFPKITAYLVDFGLLWDH